MPEITMCAHITCPIRATCKRSPESGTKPSQLRQKWFALPHYDGFNGDNFGTVDCRYYWPAPGVPDPVSDPRRLDLGGYGP